MINLYFRFFVVSFIFVVYLSAKSTLLTQPVLTSRSLGVSVTSLYKIEKTVVMENLKGPWSMTWLKEKGKPLVLITESKGDVWVLRGGMKSGRLYRLEGLPSDVIRQGQGGWLDVLAVKAVDGYKVYLSYSKKVEHLVTTELIRFSLRATEHGYFADNVEHLFTMLPAYESSRHFGGRIVWVGNKSVRYSGHIFLSLGDRGHRLEAQDRSNPVGGIVWIEVDEKGKTGKSQLYSYGHRNVQGFFYDKGKKVLWATEHGPQGGDELNIIRKNKNYGWPAISYGKEYGTSTPVSKYTHKRGMEQPIIYWDPSPAFSGLWIYRGKEFPAWNGQLFLGALKYQRVYRLEIKRNKTGDVVEKEQLFTNELGRVRSIKQNPFSKAGEIYLVIGSPGMVVKIMRKR